MLKTASKLVSADQIITPVTLADDLTLSTGNLVIGTSGKGIDFSATPGTGTSELLDDYEEGAWTPDLRFDGDGTGVTYTSRGGKYCKIGSVVYVTFDFVLSSKGAQTGAAGIYGLPFTANASIGVACSIGYYAALSSAIVIQGRFADSNSIISLGKPTSSAGMQNVTDGDFTNTTRLSGSGFYFTF